MPKIETTITVTLDEQDVRAALVAYMRTLLGIPEDALFLGKDIEFDVFSDELISATLTGRQTDG